jgi:Transposase DDE domain
LAACCDRGRTSGLIVDDANCTAAIDSTGLETRHASMHFQRRCGRTEAMHAAWPKLTAVFHTASQLIVGAVATRGPSQDSSDFPAAVRQAAANLQPRRLLGDKGYDAEHNHALCRQELGIRSTVIPLNPRNASGPPKGRYRRMMHDRFPNRWYRHRAQAESGFSRHKRRLGSALTARAEPNQFKELLIRTLTHNIMILAKPA